jgi:CDP-diacylglycerol---glycerol-3-phosphate 3-phosphatidyltransferase
MDRKIKEMIPNALTIFRIVLVPFYLLSLYSFNGGKGSLYALVIFATAGITDYLDGYLARRFKSVSDFGKVADPLADKIIVSVALITLAIPPLSMISLVAVVIIIIREIIVTYIRSYYKRSKIFVAANIWGKLKTVLQMVGIIAALLYSSLEPYIEILSEFRPTFVSLLQIYFWIVVVVTLVSGVSYLPFINKGKPRT